jgi:hypothetical protein
LVTQALMAIQHCSADDLLARGPFALSQRIQRFFKLGIGSQS